MQIVHKAAIALSGGLLVTGLSAMPAAFASPTPGTCSTAAPAPTGGTPPNSRSGGIQGGNCTVGAEVQVATTLSFEVDTNQFTLSSAAESPVYNMIIGSNDPLGYYVSEAANNANFTGATSSSDLLADSHVHAGTNPALPPPGPNACAFQGSTSTPLSTTPFTVVAVPALVSGNYQCAGGLTPPPGTDAFSIHGWVESGVPANQPADNYENTVQLALWGS